MLEVGQSFPKFSLPDENNKMTMLSDFAGHWLVLYVYPKDDTPGCTIQGQRFTATKTDFDKINARVVGLSQDDSTSHKEFCNKFGLKIALLADTKAELLTQMGIKQSDWKGMKFWDRTTFVIDPKGLVRKIYHGVKPEGHEQEVLKDLQNFQAKH